MIDLKKVVSEPLRKKNGVYSIRNTVNNKMYIGSNGKETGIYQRLQNHLNRLRKNKHENSKLQRAWNKYGEEAFEFKVRLICKPEIAVKLEQVYMDVCLKASDNTREFSELGYNLKRIAGSSKGYKYTEKQKENVSKGIINSGCSKGERNPRHGVKISEEQKQKTINTWLKSGFIKPFYQVDRDFNIIAKYNTAKEAARKLNCDLSLITACLKEKLKTGKGFMFSYIDDLENKIKVAKEDIYYFNKNKGILKGGFPVRAISKENGNITEYPSISNASKILNINAAFIQNCLKGIKNSRKYKFEYI